MLQVACSIVVYKNKWEELNKAIQSFLQTKMFVKLYLIDNSPTDDLKYLINKLSDPRVEYVYVNKNIGFGAGHNIALSHSMNIATYHLILNPDVWYKPKQLEILYKYMEERSDVGIACPKVYYNDGNLQYLCRMLPSPFDFFVRRFLPKSIYAIFEDKFDKYEFKHKSYEEEMEVPFLSGCFMLIRNEAIRQIGFFDEKFFMYCEDIDMTRRISVYYKTIYYPKAQIYHGYAKESTKNFKLWWISLQSAIYYFNKWGWFYDKERFVKNKKSL